MRNTLRAQQPVTALAACAIIATAGLLSACSSASPAPAPQSPPRHAAVHLDAAKFSKVTVFFRESDSMGLRFRKPFRSPAVIARLTRIVNSLPAAKPASMACPAAAFTYQMLFTGIGSQPDTMVTTRSCPADRVSVGGKLQGPLWDRKGAVAAEVKRLMHIKISRSGSGGGAIPPM
jgi:hypothetical protein